MSTNAKKVEVLGMPFGTASARLKKNIMFALLKKHSEDVCFQCSKQIMTVDELSVEHKDPWMANGVEAFWDINNIAFSHLYCNVRAHAPGDPTALIAINQAKRRIGPDGQYWCTGGQHFEEESEFFEDRSRWNGRCSECRTCRSNRRSPKVTPF